MTARFVPLSPCPRCGTSLPADVSYCWHCAGLNISRATDAAGRRSFNDANIQRNFGGRPGRRPGYRLGRSAPRPISITAGASAHGVKTLGVRAASAVIATPAWKLSRGHDDNQERLSARREYPSSKVDSAKATSACACAGPGNDRSTARVARRNWTRHVQASSAAVRSVSVFPSTVMHLCGPSRLLSPGAPTSGPQAGVTPQTGNGSRGEDQARERTGARVAPGTARASAFLPTAVRGGVNRLEER